MAWAAVDEAVRNCVAVGADPDRIALLDNFCWGNPTLPDRLGSLVRCAQGCYDAAVPTARLHLRQGQPEQRIHRRRRPQARHPGTLLISALGIVPDVRRTVTMDLKAAGDRLYVVGLTGGELGGSAYFRLDGLAGRQPPQPVAHGWRSSAPARRNRRGLVRACHDCSEGGLAVAVAEMALAGGLGLELRLGATCRSANEALTDARAGLRRVAGPLHRRGAPEDAARVRGRQCAGLPCAPVGSVHADDQDQCWSAATDNPSSRRIVATI